MSAIDIVQVGLGPLGQKIGHYLRERPGAFNIVGAVDVDPQMAGQSHGDVAIVSSIDEVVKSAKPQAAVVTTVSDMERISPQIEAIIAHGIAVVSTCEELSYPWDANPKLAKRIDDAAKANGVAVLGTGINPGYLMDFLPITLTGVCQQVEKVNVWRVQDAQHRRIPFQRKIGAGLTLEEFEAKRLTGTLRHVGLAESVAMIAGRMGWKLSDVVDELSPVMGADGKAAGVQQIGRGYVNGQEKITLTFIAAVGQDNPHDTVEIVGQPNIKSTIEGGVNGDIATCAITINAVKQVLRAQPGLVTMTDVPVVSFFE